jgi:uncharacterized protein (TIGR04255 family)
VLTERPPDLPNYTDPPVDEVAIALQFAPVPNFSDSVIADFFQRVRDAYPNFQYQPRFDFPVEHLAEPAAPQAMINLNPIFAPMTAPQMGNRTWLVSEDESSLIQLQDNWFAHNWRHRLAAYPQFESILAEFRTRYEQFKELLAALGITSLQVFQVEVTYTNWITDLDISEFLGPAETARIRRQTFSDPPEQQFWAASYLIRAGDSPVGRLRVSCNTAMRFQSGHAPNGVAFQLSFKAPTPPGVTEPHVFSLIGLGRESILNAFTDLTTETAHAHWGRIRV